MKKIILNISVIAIIITLCSIVAPPLPRSPKKAIAVLTGICDTFATPDTLSNWVTSDFFYYSSTATLDTLRQYLINDLYGSVGDTTITLASYDSIATNYKIGGGQLAVADTFQVDSIITLIFDNDYDLRMYMYHLRRGSSGDTMIIMPFGHQDDFDNYGEKVAINKYLDAGFQVICGYMIARGSNEDNDSIATHDNMKLLEGVINPLQLFIEPWFKAINYAIDTIGCSYVAVSGHSGGGWTTDWICALSDKVNIGFNNAGSHPLKIRDGWRSTCNDYEQGYCPPYSNPVITRTTAYIINKYKSFGDYIGLYSLSSQNKPYYHLLNMTDDCCFMGGYYCLWEDDLQSQLTAISASGSYTVIPYYYGSHFITPAMTDTIINRITNDTSTLPFSPSELNPLYWNMTNTDFDGATHIDVGNNFENDCLNGDVMTIAVRLKPDDGQPASIEIPLGFRQSNYRFMQFNNTDGTITMRLSDNVAVDYTGASNDVIWANGATDSTVIMWEMSFSNTPDDTVKLWVNNVQKTLSSTQLGGNWVGFTAASSNFYYGARNNAGSADTYYNGFGRHLMFIPRKLTATERTNLYQYLRDH